MNSPATFLGLDGAEADPEKAAVVVLPVPYEATASYGRGSAKGPEAILEASAYVELYDQELGREPCRSGIHTLEPVLIDDSDPVAAVTRLQAIYTDAARACGERFLVMLGGEHTVSAAAIRAQAALRGERVSVLQLDAHADLRARYEGSEWSHACAMARVLDVADVVCVGARGVSTEEVEVIESRDDVHLIWADEMHEDDAWMDRALAHLRHTVYLTADVDYFDPSIMPSTGTPEPGGPGWYRTLRFLRRVFQERDVIACDVVELAPIDGLHAPDFTAAKLVYKLIGYKLDSHRRAVEA